jgi:hypothetical protein
VLPLSLLGPSHQSATIEEGITYSKGATITLHERQETASQVVAMLDDIADAIWILSDEKMPRQDKNSWVGRGRALDRGERLRMESRGSYIHGEGFMPRLSRD